MRAAGRGAALALLLALGCSLLSASGAAAEPLTAYRAALATALDATGAAEAGDEAARGAALALVQQQVLSIQRVELDETRVVVVEHGPLARAVASSELDRARTEIAVLVAAIDAAVAAPAPPADARMRLDAVLARPEFRPRPPSPLDRLLQPLREPVERALRWIVYRLAGLGGLEGDARWGLAALGLVALVAVLALVVGAVSGSVAAGAQAAAARASRRQSADEVRARAWALAAAGQYRAAVHDLYLATLLHLDERGLLRYWPSLTNREHLRAGNVVAELAPTLAPLVESYDRLWYSGAPCTAGDWQRFARLVEPAWRAA